MKRCAPALVLLTLCALAGGCQAEPLHLDVAEPQIGEFAQPASQPDIDPADAALGKQLGPDFCIRHTEHFAFFADDPAWCDAAGPSLEKLYREFLASFEGLGFEPTAPQGRLVWICFAARDGFDHYMRLADRMTLPWLDGYYSARTNRVALVRPGGPGSPGEAAPPVVPPVAPEVVSATRSAGRPGQPVRPIVMEQPVLVLAQSPSKKGESGELTEALHEAGHQISFNCGLLRRGVMYPLWVTEGLATNFESGSPRDHVRNPIRVPRLVNACAAHEPSAALVELAVQTRTQGDGDEAQADYALAWGLFRFLFQEHGPQLRRYLATLTALPPGRRDPATLQAEFVAAFGPMKDLQPQWDKFLHQLAEEPKAECPVTSAP